MRGAEGEAGGPPAPAQRPAPFVQPRGFNQMHVAFLRTQRSNAAA
jgi:hypothetical protein